MTGDAWTDVGASEELARKDVQEVRVGTKRIALTCRDGEFGAISGTCNHVGGPLGQGTIEGDFVVCPGTTTSSTGGPAKASPATRRTACPPMPSRSTTAAYSSPRRR